jgi:NTE family protein
MSVCLLFAVDGPWNRSAFPHGNPSAGGAPEFAATVVPMAPLTPSDGPPEVAFVLGGGGVHGAVEVGMLRALAEHGIAPDVILGTSIGALNGVLLAADPARAVERLTALWLDIEQGNPFEAPLREQVATIARTWTHLHGNERLQRMLMTTLPVHTFEELHVPFACVAASVERAAAHWFTTGPLIPALLATTAVPGLLPPVAIDGEHFLDGGLVDSIPVARAVELGARRIMVLQVGRIEQPLAPPTRPWEVATVAFEIARRHRFAETLAALPPGVELHVLPSGLDAASAAGLTGLSQLRYRDTSRVGERIEAAHAATSAYLAESLGSGHTERRSDVQRPSIGR